MQLNGLTGGGTGQLLRKTLRMATIRDPDSPGTGANDTNV